MRMKKIWPGMVSLIALTAVVQAGTIVKWGEAGGDTTILTYTGNVQGQNQFPDAFNPATLVNPSDGVGGYDVNAVGRTHVFSGADNGNFSNTFVGNAAGDYMQLINNYGAGVTNTFLSMVAWQSSEFLTTDDTLESFKAEFKSRDSTDVVATSFLLETSSGWYVSDQTFAGSGNAYVAVDVNIAALTWTGFSGFGVTAATDPVDTSDILSVGIYSSTYSEGGFAGTFLRHFEVTATGGGALPNQPPVADAQSVDVVQNTFVEITLTGSDAETATSNLTYSVGSPTNGVLSLVTNQTYTYTPDTDYLGPDSFTFTVNDGETNSAPATVSISVNTNSPPVANAQNVIVAKNTFVDITLTGSDPDGSTLTYSVADTPTNGVLSGPVTNLTYTPNTDYTGPDSFTFTVNDGETNSAPATVSILVYTPPAEGTTLYSEDFSVDPGYTNAISIGAAGGTGPYFTFGQYAGTSDIGTTTDASVLHFDSNTTGSSARSRGLTVFIDTSAAGIGTYTVSFDVTNWVAGTGTAGLKVLGGSGLDTSYLDLDYGDNDANASVPKKIGGAATWSLLGSTWGAGTAGTGISSNGTVSLEVTLTKAGQAGDYLALAWVQVRSIGTELAPTFDVDNVWVGVGAPPASSYSAWALSYNLIGDDALEGSDVEPDGLDNLMEYALGGNPTVDDAATVSPGTYMEAVGGTNWFYQVYNQNTDPKLTFTLGATPDLVYTAADTNDVELVGESAKSGGFKTVTNRTEASTDAKFIKLEVSQ